MAHKTQGERIIDFLKIYGSITRLQAANILGCFELSARIGELEKLGYTFGRTKVTKRRQLGDDVWHVTYMKYTLEEEPC